MPILIGGCAFVIAAIVLATSLVIRHGRTDAAKSLDVALSNLANSFSVNINNSIQRIDLGILSVMDEVSRQQKAGQWDDQSMVAVISREDARHPDSVGFRVFGPDGRLRYAVSNVANRDVNISQREEFKQMKEDSSETLLVTPPFFGPVAQQFLIVLARRISNPDGSFGGAIYTAIPIQRLIQIFSGLNLGPGGSVALYHTNFQLAARFPELKVGTSTISDQLRAVIESGVPAARFENLSPVDGVQRSGLAQKIDGMPYYLSVALANDDYLTEWRHNRDNLIKISGFLIGIVLLGTLFLYRTFLSWRTALGAQFQLEALIRSAPIANAMFDRNMNYLATSDRWLAEYGRGYPDLIGRNHYQLHPDLPAEWKSIHHRALAGATIRNDEDMWVQADGSEHWLRWAVVPWTDENGAIGGIIISAENITKRKQAEGAINAAKEVAERANEAKSRFLAAASHDLRQPLQALNLYFAVLMGRMSPGEDHIIKGMEVCLANLGDLLNDLLDLSKLEAQVVSPDKVDFPLNNLFQIVLSSLAPAAEAKGIRLRSVPTGLWARTDLQLFARAITNLVTNAVRYTEHGGVVIGCRRRRGAVWIEVADTGIGIPSDKHDEIFEEFRQLENEERRREKGSGLGLAIVKRTASLLGLDIRVTSRIGRGSIFALSVPVGAPTEKASSLSAATDSRHLCIALVEDDAGVREALSVALTTIGHDVVGAPSTDALLARLGHVVPDVLIADYRLGEGETGLDTVAAISARLGKNIPAVILTGDTDPIVVRKITASGATVLHKPLQFDVLKASIVECTMFVADETGA